MALWEKSAPDQSLGFHSSWPWPCAHRACDRQTVGGVFLVGVLCAHSHGVSRVEFSWLPAAQQRSSGPSSLTGQSPERAGTGSSWCLVALLPWAPAGGCVCLLFPLLWVLVSELAFPRAQSPRGRGLPLAWCHHSHETKGTWESDAPCMPSPPSLLCSFFWNTHSRRLIGNEHMSQAQPRPLGCSGVRLGPCPALSSDVIFALWETQGLLNHPAWTRGFRSCSAQR